MDFNLFHAVNGLAGRSDLFEDLMRIFAVDAQYFFVALMAALFLAAGRWASENLRRAVIAAGLSAGLALGIAQVISGFVERSRPYVTHPHSVHLFIPASADPSFPSDHATAAFAISVSILLRNRRAGYVAIFVAVVMSVGRVAVGTHYPGDVLAGAALGALAALFFWIPVIRRYVDLVADWLGGLYDRIWATVTRKQVAARPSA